DPVLVASIDGVGTKLKIAFAMNKHDTVGADLVNHCVNDIAVLGARPLFLLDYIGCEKLEPKVFRQLLGGLSLACRSAGCALIGGHCRRRAVACTQELSTAFEKASESHHQRSRPYYRRRSHR